MDWSVRITADTNVLVRAAVFDDPAQAELAADTLRRAELIAIPLPVLCEFVWVLSRGYGKSSSEIGTSLRRLADSGNVSLDRAAFESGLAVLDADGDFADGVIAVEGRRLGGLEFTSFDRTAVELINAIGGQARLLSSG